MSWVSSDSCFGRPAGNSDWGGAGLPLADFRVAHESEMANRPGLECGDHLAAAVGDDEFGDIRLGAGLLRRLPVVAATCILAIFSHLATPSGQL